MVLETYVSSTPSVKTVLLNLYGWQFVAIVSNAGSPLSETAIGHTMTFGDDRYDILPSQH